MEDDLDLYFGSGEESQEPAEPTDLASALLYEHPDYCEYLPKWMKYHNAYSANDIYQYIHKHPRESADMFEVRIKRGYYYNYVASIVDLYVAYLFHSPIERKGADDAEYLAQLYENADGKRTRYDLFLQSAATDAQIFGHVGILIDMPKALFGTIKTEQDREDAGLWPYLSIIKSTAILDWELDRNGKFEWVKIEVCRPNGRSWQSAVDAETRHFVIWTKNDWTEYKVVSQGGEHAATITADGRHNVGEVPLVILKDHADPNHSWFGTSAVRDITDINLALLNWSSMGDEEIAERCLNILCMERDEGGASRTLSHANVLEYMPGSQAPQYLVPGETPLEMIGKWIDRAKDEIYRLAKLGGSTGLLGFREATSGIAYAYEFNETNQSLARKAEYLQQAETEIHRLYLKWLGKQFSGSIQYPREFGVEDFLQQFQLLAESRQLLSSPTAIKEMERNLAAKLFAREAPELRQLIDLEIETANPQPLGLMESFTSVPPKMNETSL